MGTVEITGREEIISCPDGSNLMEVLRGNGITFENACGGKGKCGKCGVRVEGVGERLACETTVVGNLKVSLKKGSRGGAILTRGYVPEFKLAPSFSGYGAAIDIGTTTVAVSLYESESGGAAGEASALNAQKIYGLDVLSRITYEYENPETGVSELKSEIVGLLNDMLAEAGAERGIRADQIREITVAANCAMTHMLLGEDARSIGRAPYKPAFTAARDIAAASIGLRAAKDARLYCLPNVSSFIGADIVAGVYVCGLPEKKGNVLFIDIGTNGEIVLKTGDRLLCCSCAAGPALEGMNISQGTRAVEGAIEEVKITPRGTEIKTIGGKTPVGICGSGILSAVKELLEAGLVRRNGAFIRRDQLEEGEYPGLIEDAGDGKKAFALSDSPRILVTQSDIRQTQLAKGAILSGFTVLLAEAGVTMDELDEVLVAGQFGAYLPADSLVGTGILPREVKDKIHYMGNTSLMGAYMALMSEPVKREMEDLAGKLEYLELSEYAPYNKVFVDCLKFPERAAAESERK